MSVFIQQSLYLCSCWPCAELVHRAGQALCLAQGTHADPFHPPRPRGLSPTVKQQRGLGSGELSV